jgi:hypothetical protein
MLGLLTALYQCDLTLHTETCVYLGAVGILAATLWVLLFVAKLYALAWAVRLRLSISATAVATLGALGLAILPHQLPDLEARGASALVGLWLFALFALGLHASRAITSRVTLDAWGETVLRRALRAVWLMWSVLLVLHVAFWSLHYAVRLAALAPVVLLLGTRWIRGEARVWCAIAATLILIAVTLPELFAVASLMAAVVLVMRTVPTRSARWRLLTGALFAVYLAVWTTRWSGGPWPAHLMPLDLALTAAVLLLVVRPRVRIALAPLSVSFAHFGIQTSVVTAPHSILQWGAASVGLGFVLLIASLVASYYLRDDASHVSGRVS